MQIKVNLKIFVFILLFIITKQIKIYGILMLFALLHEIGHLAVGILLGFKPKSLSIKPVGLSISFKTSIDDIEQKVKKGNMLELKKIFIGLAGPIINLIFATFYIKNDFEIFAIPREIGAYSNILIGIFNLIPIYPLDGGRILKSLLHIFLGYKKSLLLIRKISWGITIVITIIASIAILYLENFAIVIIIAYLWGLNINNNMEYKKYTQLK